MPMFITIVVLIVQCTMYIVHISQGPQHGYRAEGALLAGPWAQPLVRARGEAPGKNFRALM